MLLAVDVGNTEITLGLFQDETLICQWRMTTGTHRTPDEWTVAVGTHLQQTGHSYSDVAGVALASVVPVVTQPLMDGLKVGTGVQPMVIDAGTDLPIELDVDEPMTVGADRVVNTLAVAKLYGCDTIAVDFGTATTFDCIMGEGRFIGGVIAPG
ncbi:MAG: type III pantothenate kinase, partial [Gemmatimonadota bacterium]|nr:type III pantothenate kinase [Gemmatimonadota bacterium]